MAILQLIKEAKLHEFYTTFISRHLRQKRTLGLAVLITVLYTIHRKISRPPPHLRHLPRIKFYSYFKALLTDVTVDQFSKEIYSPVVATCPGAYVQPVIGLWIIQLTDPVAIKQLLMKTESFPKSDINQGIAGTLINRFIGGANIVMLNGADWRRHRKIANPVFAKAAPVKLFGELTLTMFKAMDQLGPNIDVLDLFERLTLDTIGKAGFGFDFHALEDRDNEWVNSYNSVKEGMLNPFFLVFHVFDTKLLKWFPKRYQVHQNLTNFLNMLDSIIEQKRLQIQQGHGKDKQVDTITEEEERDLLTLMIESEQSENASLSNEELRRNLCIFFLAGHDTTAFTLALMISELALHPDMQEKARQEAINILGDVPYDVLPTAEDTKNMTYINAVMKEVMRLHNPVLNTTAREATQDTYLGQVFIPKGSLVSADILNVHRNPKIWKDPYKFSPDRFLPGGEADQQPTNGLTWLPFSSGGRICIGQKFSLYEQYVVLSMLLRKYSWKLAEGSIHADGLKTHGVAFGIISTKDLNITFEKRY